MYNLYRYVYLSTYIYILYIMPRNLLFAADGSLQRTGISKTVKIGTIESYHYQRMMISDLVFPANFLY